MHFSLPSALFSIQAYTFLWQTLFWGCVASVIYTYVGYPLLLWTIVQLRNPSPTSPSTEPGITLLICAHNEAKNIGRKLAESLALNYPASKLQILVASDGSTDQTVEIVRSFAAQGVELIIVPQQAGKTNAQNIAVQHATGEIIVFSDATTQYHSDALQYIAGNFTDHSVGAVSGCYRYVAPDRTSPTGAGAKTYAGYDNLIRQMQSQISSITGCCGCIYAVRRTLYTPLDPQIISDFVEPLHILLKGAQVKFEPRAIASESSTATSRKEFSMRVRVITRALNGISSVSELLHPWKHPWIALQLLSHKLLRYAVPLALIGILFSSVLLLQIPFYRAIVVSQILFYGLAFVAALLPHFRISKLLRIPLYFCVLNAAALAGIMQFIRGQRYISWKPERETSHVH